MTKKLCPHCGEVKPADQFDRRPDSDRAQSWCLSCKRWAASERMKSRIKRGMCKYGEHPRGADGTPTMCRAHADRAASLKRQREGRRPAEVKT